jgi:hypothetical protein
MQAIVMNTFVLFSRKGCHLCERAEDMVTVYFPGCPVLDVDADQVQRRLYGMRVPVLVVGGEVVLEGYFEEIDVAKLAMSVKSRDEFHGDSGHE